MDPKTVKNPEILHLLRQSEASRTSLAAEMARIRHRLDVPTRVTESLKNHPLAWLLGSLGSGLAVSLFFRRKPAIIRQSGRGLKSALLGYAFTAARPLLEAWLAGRLKNWVGGLVKSPDEAFMQPVASPKIKSR